VRKEERQAATAKPQLLPRVRKIVDVVSGLPSRIDAQVWKIGPPVLFDSRSVRSLISCNHFEQLSLVDFNVHLLTIDGLCNYFRAEFGNCRTG